MRIVGIDPGGRGALALMDGRKLEEVRSMPVNYVRRGKTDKPELDVWTLSEILSVWSPDVCYFEQVGGHPGDSAQSAFSFGRISGACEALVRTCSAQFHWAPPIKWKRAMGLISAGKDGAIAKAQALFPEYALQFAGQKKTTSKIAGEGLAEAALLAEYGRRVENKELPR